MREPKQSTRRQFLAVAGGVAVLGAVPVVSLQPAQATPDTMKAAIRDVVKGATVRPGRVKLDVPPLVENGNTVPLVVSVTSPMTASDHVVSIHVFNEKNPQPNVGNFISVRVRDARRSRPASGCRHANDYRDCENVRRLVLVHQRRRRCNARGLHRGGKLMASALINVPATAKRGEVIEIKTLMSHIMETGFRHTVTGAVIRATSSPTLAAATTASRYFAPSCFLRSRRIRSSRSSPRRRRAERSIFNGVATTASRKPLRPPLRLHETVLRNHGIAARDGRHGLACSRDGNSARRAALGIDLHVARDAGDAER